MKRIIGAIALLACTALPAAADGNYNRNNQFHNWQHNRQYYKHHNNNYNGWELGGAFVGGLIIGNMLNDRPGGYYVPPPAYHQPYPQYRNPPVWAGPRYCETMTYYDAWGNLVRARNCYR